MLTARTCPRYLNTNYRLSKHLNTTKQTDFRTVYKFPYIRGLGLINRLKLYQTAITSAVLPSAVLLCQFDVISYDDVQFAALVGLSGLIPLYGFGFFTNKLVGIVYLSDQKNLVKIAYLDFWGGRKDTEAPLQDIIPFSELPPSLTDPLYLKLKRYSSKNTLKLCSRFGVVDVNGFNKVFIS